MKGNSIRLQWSRKQLRVWWSLVIEHSDHDYCWFFLLSKYYNTTFELVSETWDHCIQKFRPVHWDNGIHRSL